MTLSTQYLCTFIFANSLRSPFLQKKPIDFSSKITEKLLENVKAEEIKVFIQSHN